MISGNTADGIRIAGAGATGTQCSETASGRTRLGTGALPNLRGIEISASASGSTVGGPLGSQNVISGNTGQGILIYGAGTTNNTVSRALIGTNAAGDAESPTGGTGSRSPTEPADNTIGGVSGDGQRHLRQQRDWRERGRGRARETAFSATSSGWTWREARSWATAQFGVAIAQGATANIVGNATGGNIISGNGAAGVQIVDNGTNNNLVQSNIIGLDATGTWPVRTRSTGVSSTRAGAATGNRIGGVGFTNVISGNGTVGVRILNGMTGTLVVANLIGRNATNSAGVPNGSGGVMSRTRATTRSAA